jgi:transcriptional regulator with XRE-family HTH domain
VEKIFGKRRDVLLSGLRRERLRAGLRLRDVSNVTRISVSRLSEVERGLVELAPEERERIRSAIAASVEAPRP